jgi:hypothetical protein
MSADQSELRAEFILEPSELARATVWWFVRRPLILAGYAFMAVAMLITWVGMSFGRARSFDFTIVIIVFGLLVIPPLFLYVSAWFRCRSLPPGQRSTQWRFSGGEVKIEAAVGRKTVTWEAFRQARETGSAFLLFPSRKVFYVIPKRAFHEREHVQSFRGLLGEKLGRRARVR